MEWNIAALLCLFAIFGGMFLEAYEALDNFNASISLDHKAHKEANKSLGQRNAREIFWICVSVSPLLLFSQFKLMQNTIWLPLQVC